MKQLIKTDNQWQKELTDEEYRVLRQGGTEMPFTGTYVASKTKGMYTCRACGNELFSSTTKFESGTGWPSFWKAADPKKVKLVEDTSHGMVRTEVRCASCGSHLGHVFDDGPQDPPGVETGKTGKRYCINSVCLAFQPNEK